MDAGIRLEGASDYGVSEAVYLRDPDENGVEVYWAARSRSGPGHPMVKRRCSHGGSMSKGCWQSWKSKPTPRKLNRVQKTCEHTVSASVMRELGAGKAH